MLPGRRYRPEDVIYLLAKWKWLVLLPWVVISAGAFVYAKTLPDRFRSESTIQVVPQRVSQNYVRSTVTAKIGERLPVISPATKGRARRDALEPRLLATFAEPLL